MDGKIVFSVRSKSTNIYDETLTETGTFLKVGKKDKTISYVENGKVEPLNMFSGKTSDRPINMIVGFVYFDTTLNKPIWWNGSTWVDATGTAV